MRNLMIAAALLAMATTLTAGPAVASFKLMKAGAPAQVGKSTLTVTPPADWNRLRQRVGRNAESWTLDGLSLNDATFYGGIAEGRTLFRQADKKNKPLPRFSATMLIPDVASMFEQSYRIAGGTSLFTIERMEPANFAGQSGFRFAYDFTQAGDEVRRKGEAIGAIVGGKLYMATFEAPVIHYYRRDLPAFRALVATARIR